MAIDAGETYVPTAQSLDGLKEGDLFGPYEIAGDYWRGQ